MKDPKKECLDTNMNQMCDNLEKSSKIPYVTTKERSVNEIATEILKGVPAIEMVVDIGDGERDAVGIREELEGRIEHTLQAKDRERDEAVMAAKISLLAEIVKYTDSTVNLNKIAKEGIEALTQTNNAE